MYFWHEELQANDIRLASDWNNIVVVYMEEQGVLATMMAVAVSGCVQDRESFTSIGNEFDSKAGVDVLLFDQ